MEFLFFLCVWFCGLCGDVLCDEFWDEFVRVGLLNVKDLSRVCDDGCFGLVDLCCCGWFGVEYYIVGLSGL